MQRAMVPELPVGFAMTIIERLNPEDTNLFFPLPSRGELTRADDDSLLRTLLPQLRHRRRYRIVRGVSDEVKQTVREAANRGPGCIQSAYAGAERLQGRLTDRSSPLPYLVYAGDGEELRLKARIRKTRNVRRSHAAVVFQRRRGRETAQRVVLRLRT